MAFMTSQGAAVDGLLSLATLFADPKKLAKDLTEIKSEIKAHEDKLQEVTEAQKLLYEREKDIEAAQEVLVKRADEVEEGRKSVVSQSTELQKAQDAFERIKSDFEALKTQTMEEYAAINKQNSQKGFILLDKEKELNSVRAEQTKVSLALDEREKALLDRETKAQELIDLYNTKLAQLKSLV